VKIENFNFPERFESLPSHFFQKRDDIMSAKEKHKQMLVDNRLRRIENRLRRIEIILLKNITTDKKIRKELALVEKEEKIIEKEQKKLEKEEAEILKEMRHLEQEEKWHIEVQYNCKAKIMEDNNIVNCNKTGKLCDMSLCPLWKK
jgi:hypothetical protein